MAVRIRLDQSQMDQLQRMMQAIGAGAGQAVDDVLHNEGGRLIHDEIMLLLPQSHRKPWKGKATAAKRTQPFTQENESLSVTIRTKNKYHYLYFPDDGTNTKNHVGYKGNPREFMKKGAENVMADIIDACTIKLLKKMGE